MTPRGPIFGHAVGGGGWIHRQGPHWDAGSASNHHWREYRAHEPLFSLILENGHFGRFWVGQRKPLWEELGGLAYRSARDMGGEEQSGLKLHLSSMRRRVYPNTRDRGPEKRNGRVFFQGGSVFAVGCNFFAHPAPQGTPRGGCIAH